MAKPVRCFSSLHGEAAQRLDLLWEHGEDAAVAGLGAGTSASSCGAPGGHRGHRPQGAQRSGAQPPPVCLLLLAFSVRFKPFPVLLPLFSSRPFPGCFSEASPARWDPAPTPPSGAAHGARRIWDISGGEMPPPHGAPVLPGVPKTQLLLGGTVLPHKDRGEDFFYSPPCLPGAKPQPVK